MAISLDDLKLDENGILMSEKPLTSPEWDILSAHLFIEWQAQKKIISSSPLLSDSLLSFFLWFRANGELYVDKPIEEMISIYQKESNVR